MFCSTAWAVPRLPPSDLSAPLISIFPYMRPTPERLEPIADDRGALLTFAMRVCNDEGARQEMAEAQEAGEDWYCTTEDGILYARLTQEGRSLLISDGGGNELLLRVAT